MDKKCFNLDDTTDIVKSNSTDQGLFAEDGLLIQTESAI